jgi:dipeptidyl aminopeptidase/acylaminoacyl peptidase
MRKRLVCALGAAILVSLSLLVTAPAAAQDAPLQGAKFTYQQAPKVIHDVLNSPAQPTVLVAPTHDRMLVVDSRRHPSVADLAQPMLRIGGLRINPATNGPHHPPRHIALRVVSIDTGKETKVALPPNAWISLPEWSFDGKHFAFLNYTPTAIQLFVGDAATAAVHVVPGVKVNAAFGGGFGRNEALNWMPDNKTLAVLTVPAGRGAVPADIKVATGPHVQESAGKVAPIPTYEDLLQNPHDEDLFDYYCTSQLNLLDIASGKITPVGKPAIFEQIDASPDGKHLLVVRLHKPYSYLIPAMEFPKTAQVWDRTGKNEFQLADLPSHEGVPLEGVLTGPRNYGWRATAPATLVWGEALDGGDTRAKVPFHDKVLALTAPFQGQPVELTKVQFRLMSRGAGVGGRGGSPVVMWGEKYALVTEYDRARRWTRTKMIDPDKPGDEGRIIWDRSAQDRYRDPGVPVFLTRANGARIVLQDGNTIFLRSEGASPKGDFPFLAKFDLETLKSERIFTAADGTYEAVEALLSNDGSKFLTRFETPNDVPNYFVRTAGSNDKKQVTKFVDPNPSLRGIQKQLVTYKREDGVPLSFTLYLPPDCGSPADKGAMPCHQTGVRMPTIVWAYPLEFSDASTAGQVGGSQYRFTQMGGISELFLVTQGYALLDSATMPVVGDPETMNDKYVEQITMSAKAAIDKAAEMGVTDPNRVGVGGHSYGAFMTANLLAHTKLFKAGVARSGAYNRTLTPFGFQSERRTFWEAPDMYLNVSPFAHAQNIKTPILLIHGEADDNSGTFPIQSERMYAAIKGNGGVVRYVTLPYEPHGYLGRESVEHVQWEMVHWFDQWVKNPKPAQNTASAK